MSPEGALVSEDRGEAGRGRPRSVRLRTPVIAVFVAAVMLRIVPIGSGLPYSDYVDEGHVLHQTLTVLKLKTFDTRWYGYPSLPSYLMATMVAAYAPVYRLTHKQTIWDALSPGEHVTSGAAGAYDLIAPPEVILLGRVVVCTFSIGTVVVTAALGARLGGRDVALAAMLVTSVCPALVSRGSIVVVDTLAAFFTVVTLLLCERVRGYATGSLPAAQWNALAAGVMAALAYGSKYTAGAVFIAVLVTIGLLRVPNRQKLWLVVSASGGFTACSVVATPMILYHPEKIINALREQATFYDSIPSSQGYWWQAISTSELTLPMVMAALLGLLWMLRCPSTSPAAVSWVALAVITLVIFLPHSFQPFRNLLPLVPLSCIAAAFFIVRLGRLTFLVGGRVPRGRWFTIIATLVVAAPSGGASVRQISERMSHVDSRVQAVNWIQQHVPEQSIIVVIEELTFQRAELARIRATPEVIPWRAAAERLSEGNFDYVVSGDFDTQHSSDATGLSAYRECWRQGLASLQLEAEFGRIPNPLVRNLWRTNDQRIFVLKALSH